MGSVELGLHIGQRQSISSEINTTTSKHAWNNAIFEGDKTIQEELLKIPFGKDKQFGLIYQETYRDGGITVDLGQLIYPVKTRGFLEDINYFGLATRPPGTQRRGDYSKNQFNLVGVAWRQAKI